LQRTSVTRVIAYIRPENASSRRAFEAAGFRYLDEAEQEGARLHRYVLERDAAPALESGS
jgi:RimJ/RimL family protein N-acetyltransferase